MKITGKFKSYTLVYTLVFIQFLCIVLILVTGPLFAYGNLYLLMEIMGLFLGAWAIWTMRFSNFYITPDVPKNSSLVITGPYKHIRHPMYSSILVVTLMLLLDLFSIYRLFIWLALLIDLILKLEYEEELLTERFSGYFSYKLRTKRLVPFVL